MTITSIASDDIQGIHEFLAGADDSDIIEGPDELYAVVAELWPEHLHKLKPPRALMH